MSEEKKDNIFCAIGGAVFLFTAWLLGGIYGISIGSPDAWTESVKAAINLVIGR